MSLQQAYSGYALNQTENDDPISKGLTAGSNAYNSGASASAYGYLSGQNAYPVAQLPSAPYESVHGISGQYSQQGIAQAAKDAPFRGKYTSSQELADQVQTKPGIAASLINTALPAYVGYKFLVPDPAKDYLASKTGFESLGSGAKAAEAAKATQAAPTATTAATPEVLGEASGKWAPTTTAPTTAATPEVLGEASGAWAPTAETTLDASSIVNPKSGTVYSSDAGTLVAVDPSVANTVNTTGVTSGISSDAAAWDAATAGEYGGEAVAAEAGMGGSELATIAAEYGPYVAAAIAADQLLFDGKISRGIDDAIIQPTVDLVGDLIEVGGGLLEDAGDFVGDAVEDVGDFVTGGGGCFMTTAAVEHAGEEDDGDTLTAVRKLRDFYAKTAKGRKDIEWYYRKAPKIVDAIDKKPNAHAIYMRMYNDHIKPIAKEVEKGKYEHAYQLYTKLIGFAKKASGLSTKELETNTKQGIPKDIKKHFAAGGLSAARRYEMGGYLDEERPKLQQYNQLGQKLDKDVSTDYELATTQRNTKKANELKNELAYRARMKKYQGRMATGGIADYNLGGYSDGGRLLKGPGDGVSDSIPATIGKAKQPARLADGEFVVPARIVSELGNGSTEAGARKLYAMMDRIQKSRKKSVGKGKVAVNSRADKHLPA